MRIDRTVYKVARIMIRTYQHEGHVVRSAQNISEWKAALAVRVDHFLRHQPTGAFISDLVKQDIMPDERKLTRRDKLNRLFEFPVEVDGRAYALTVRAARTNSVYEKTRRIEPCDSLPTEQQSSNAEIAPSWNPAPSAPSAPTTSFDIVAFEDAVARRVLATVEMMYGTGSTAGGSATAPEDIIAKQVDAALMAMRRRVWLTEMNLGRLTDHVIAKKPYEPFKLPEDVEVDQ